MTINLQDQKQIATDEGLRARVEPATVRVAFAQPDMAPILTGTGQVQRMALADAIVRQSDYAVGQFTWLLVTQPNLQNVDALDDAQIGNFVKNNFDKVAQMIMPTSGGP